MVGPEWLQSSGGEVSGIEIRIGGGIGKALVAQGRGIVFLKGGPPPMPQALLLGWPQSQESKPPTSAPGQLCYD